MRIFQMVSDGLSFSIAVYPLSIQKYYFIEENPNTNSTLFLYEFHGRQWLETLPTLFILNPRAKRYSSKTYIMTL